MNGDDQASLPKVSVIMPTYNQSDYLPSAIDSVMEQTFGDFELIIVNDGSTDNSAKILTSYEKYSRVRILHQENRKLPGALNTGFSLARGRYLTWTSSDNLLFPNMLEVLVSALDSWPEVGLVYADWQLIDYHDQIVGEVCTFEYDPYLLMRINFINTCFLYRSECQKMIGFYDQNYLYVEDWEYWLRMSRVVTMRHVAQVLYRYRVHDKAMTAMGFHKKADKPQGLVRLLRDLRSRKWARLVSKLKYEQLRIKLGRDPRKVLQPFI